MHRTHRSTSVLVLGLLACVGVPAGLGMSSMPAPAPAPAGPDFPPFDKTIEGLDKVTSTMDGSSGLYDLYKDDKTGKLLAVLPGNFESQMLMIACTVVSTNGSLTPMSSITFSESSILTVVPR